MNTYLTRTALALSSLLLLAACGTATGEDADTRTVPQKRADVSADATYDGWAVRLRRDSAPSPCSWSPDQVQRMKQSGAPLPSCVRRNAEWFRTEFEPVGGQTHRADR